MSRPSPSEQAALDAASDPRDCRHCRHSSNIRRNASIFCSVLDRRLSWHAATSASPCHRFEPNGAPVPSPAAQPESTERMGDALFAETLRNALREPGRACTFEHWSMIRQAREKIAEEVTRARSRESALATALHAVEWAGGAAVDRCPFCNRAKPEGHRPECKLACALSGAPVEDPRDATIRAAVAALAKVEEKVGRLQCRELFKPAPRDGCPCESCLAATAINEALAALRSAGVEPDATTQGGTKP